MNNFTFVWHVALDDLENKPMFVSHLQLSIITLINGSYNILMQVLSDFQQRHVQLIADKEEF